MNRGHESFHNTNIVTDDLDWIKQVVVQEVLLTILTGCYALCGSSPSQTWGRDDDPLDPTLQVGSSLFHGSEDTSRFNNIFGTSITPFDVGGVLILEDVGGLPVDDKLLILSLDCAVEFVMNRVILRHVDCVVKMNEGVFYGNDFHFAGPGNSPGNQAPNIAKSIHSGLCHHVLGTRLSLHKETQLNCLWDSEKQKTDIIIFLINRQ